MTTDLNPQHLGSDFADFLNEEWLLAETEAVATKRVIAWPLEQAMQARGLTKRVFTYNHSSP